MSYRLEDQPEYAGPMSEDPEPGQARLPTVSYPAPARLARDPSAEAIERTIAAERAADAAKTVPPDALDLTAQPVTPPPPRRSHKRKPPPDAEPAAETADTPEDAA